MDKIDRLIINSPYSESTHYWSYNIETNNFSLKGIWRHFMNLFRHNNYK